MHMIRGMVEVDRIAGYPSESLVFHTAIARFALVRSPDFDRVLADEPGLATDERHWAAIGHLLLRADIWVTFFDSFFFPPAAVAANAGVLKLLRFLGIRIIAAQNGLDVLYEDGQTSRFDWFHRLRLDYPAWDLTAEKHSRRRHLESVCHAAHLVVAADTQGLRFLPRADLAFKYFPADLLVPYFSANISGAAIPADRAIPLIIHAPNHRNWKGTDHLIRAIEVLQKAKIACELQLVERVSREEAVRIYTRADIIADQFCCGIFGVFALEGLALAKPVVGYLDERHLGDPVFDLGIVNGNPDNLSEVLAALVASPELRRRLGEAGRRAVASYQSVEALAEVWDVLYRSVWLGEALDLSRARHFQRKGRRSFSEDPTKDAFWPVDTTGVMQHICEAVESVRNVTGRIGRP